MQNHDLTVNQKVSFDFRASSISYKGPLRSGARGFARIGDNSLPILFQHILLMIVSQNERLIQSIANIVTLQVCVAGLLDVCPVRPVGR